MFSCFILLDHFDIDLILGRLLGKLIFVLLGCFLVRFHKTAFDVDCYWEEIDEEKTKDCTVELNDLSQTDSEQGSAET